MNRPHGVEDASGRRALEHTCALMMVLDAEITKAVMIGDEIVTRLAGGRSPIEDPCLPVRLLDERLAK
jgi:hypothetical protein